MRWSHRALASSLVNQFTKGPLFSDLWALTELELPLNQKKSARKNVQERAGISLNVRKTDLVEQAYDLNNFNCGMFGCPE